MDQLTQREFKFEFPPPEPELLQLLSVSDIYERATQYLFEKLKEDRRLERKSAGVHAEALGPYFSMWANTPPEGGLLIIGQENDGSFTGCAKLDQRQLNRLEQAGDIYAPGARSESKRIAIRTPEGNMDFLLVIWVRYRKDRVVEDNKGDAWVRGADSKRKLHANEKSQLQIDKGEVQFEQESCGLDYPDKFDMDAIHQFVTNVISMRELDPTLLDVEVLEQRRLGTRQGKKFIPNNACALLFARDPNRLFPGNKIRFLRYDGEIEGTGDRFNAVKDIWIEGQVPHLIMEAEKVLDAQVRSFSRLGKDGRFEPIPEYPKLAWYEAIVNACVHRMYYLKNMSIFVKMFDDRLVVESPGAFPPPVTPRNIYGLHHPRNPILMEALFYMRFVKCANEGTRRMRDTMEAMDLPEPEFTVKENGYALVRVTLRNNIKHRRVWIDRDAVQSVGEALFKTLNEREVQIINYVAEYKNINVTQAQRLLGAAWNSSKNILMGLVAKGILIQIHRKDLDRDPKAYFTLKSHEPKK